MSGGIKATGMDELKRDLKAVSEDLDAVPVFDEIAKRAARLAASFAPHRSGRLAASIRPTTTDNRAVVSALAPYAAVINYGSPRRGIKASRFLQRVDPAIEAEAVTRLEKALDQLITKRSLK